MENCTCLIRLHIATCIMFSPAANGDQHNSTIDVYKPETLLQEEYTMQHTPGVHLKPCTISTLYTSNCVSLPLVTQQIVLQTSLFNSLCFVPLTCVITMHGQKFYTYSWIQMHVFSIL